MTSTTGATPPHTRETARPSGRSHADVATPDTGSASGRPASTREDFNLGWSYRRRVTAFQELAGGGGAWTEVVLPHDAVISSPRSADTPRGDTTGYFGGGAFEYRKTFTVPEDARGKQAHLVFDGVYRDAMVFVNGALAGQHAYGYSRFTVRIDPYLAFGADNEVRVECRAHLDSRWYAGAGIHRDVSLVTKPPTHIALDGVRVSTPDIDEDRAVVEIEVRAENGGTTTSTPTLHAVIADAEGTGVARGTSPVTLPPGDTATARLRMYVPEPSRWNVDTPSLYSLGLQLRDGEELLDEESVSFGIRSLQLDPLKGLRINGEPVKLRGACIHSDNGPLGAAAIRRAEERKVQLLKDAGFNAVRSAHNPASPALLEACDRLGMLVMDETFDVWTSGKSDFDYAFDFPQWWERDVESMVAKDFNHPSVILYSIGNEIPETGHRLGARLGRRLAEKIRSLDSTRLVTNGINGMVSVLDTVIAGMQQRREAAIGGVNSLMNGFGQMMDQLQTMPVVTERTEEAFAVLDVAGMNYGEARYETDRERFPNRIIAGTETWPTMIDRNWALVERNSHVIGDFTWTGLDYLGEAGIGVIRYATDAGGGATGFASEFPGLTAGCGDLDITGHRRPVSYYRETVFGLRSTPYIAVQRPERHGKEIALATPWAWSDTIASWTWHGFEGKPVAVEVYSDAEDVELLLDGASIGRARVGERRAFRADFEVTYQPGELTAVAYSGGVETGRTSLASASGDLVLVAEADRRELGAGTSDLGFVALTLTDGHGVVQNGHDRAVTVTVGGPAVLQALGSGNPVSEEGFTASEHRTFDGRALAVIRPTGAGEITVTAAADGCTAVSTTLRAG